MGIESFILSQPQEVPVTNIFRDKIVEAEELPVKYVSHTPCFRSDREAMVATLGA